MLACSTLDGYYSANDLASKQVRRLACRACPGGFSPRSLWLPLLPGRWRCPVRCWRFHPNPPPNLTSPHHHVSPPTTNRRLSATPSPQAITEFLFEDCPPEAPCACSGVAFNGEERAAQKGRCCASLRVSCQPLFGGLACAEVEAFCSDNLPSPTLNKFVQHKLHDATCAAEEQVAAAAPAPAAGGVSAAQAAGIAVGVVVGLAVLAGVAHAAIRAARAPSAGASAPLLAAPGSAATSGPQLLGISS